MGAGILLFGRERELPVARGTQASKNWIARQPRLSGLRGRAGKIGFNAEMGAAPVAEGFHHGNQFLPFLCERVGYLGWLGGSCGARNHAIALQLPELIGEHLLGNLVQLLAEFRKPPRTKRKMPQDLDLPFSGHDVNRGLNGTPVMVLHGPIIKHNAVNRAS